MAALLRGWSIRAQLLALIVLVFGAAVGLFAYEEWNRAQASVALTQLKDDALATVVDIKALSDKYAVTAVDTMIKVSVGRIDGDTGQARIAALLPGLDTLWGRLQSRSLDARKHALLQDALARRAVCEDLLARAAALMVVDDREGLRALVEGPMYPTIDPLTADLQAMVDLALQDAAAAVAAEQVRQARTSLIHTIALVLVFLLLLFGARGIARNIYRGVEALIAEARGIRDEAITDDRDVPAGELGEVMVVMREMHREIAGNEAQLREALQQANEASRAKSAFVSTMSHEIRTPLIGVTGMLEVLSHTPLDAEQRRIIGVIEHSAEALLQIIGDVLDFSKIEADRLSLDPEPADLALLVRNVVANFEGAASSKGLVVTVQILDSVGPAYWVDPLRVRQVLSNLLGNALKFTSEGGIDVVVRALSNGEAGDIVQLTVRDSGIGVTTEQVDKLFQPFTQAEASTTRRFGGTGLGLSICKRLVEMMGGTLTMHGMPGEGTTVGVVLPLPRAPVEAVAVRKPADIGNGAFQRRPAPSVEDAQRLGRLVLLADDHPTNREVISRQLAIAGYACETAVHGVDALQKLKTGRYAFLLTDLHMPELDGLALARAWRAEEASRGRKRLPVFAISAAVSTADVADCLAAGMDGHLPKPLPIAELAKTLDRFLGAPPAAAVTAPVPAVPPGATSPPFDRFAAFDSEALSAITGGDPAALQEVVDEFIASTEADFTALQQALVDRPADAQRLAHRIKGAARLMGASTLAVAAGEIEIAVRDGQPVSLMLLGEALRALRPAASSP